MSLITREDGTRIFYKQFGEGPTVVLSHGWPLCADAWDNQMLFLSQHGCRVIAHDRRGFGRSGQPATGCDYDTFADDLAALLQELDVRDAVLVGHSMGGGEVVRFLGRHGTSRVRAAVTVGAVPPKLLRSDTNPHGVPQAVLDEIRHAVATDRPDFFRKLARTFYNADMPGSTVSDGTLDHYLAMALQGAINFVYGCVEAFSETDFSEDLKRIDIPLHLIHGDADQIVPLEGSSRLALQLAPNASLTIYEGGSHGPSVTERDRLNQDLLRIAHG